MIPIDWGQKKKLYLRECTQKNFWACLSIFRQKFLEEVWVPVLGRLGESQKKQFFLSKLEMYVFN